jgi:integrase/recombinase XerD
VPNYLSSKEVALIIKKALSQKDKAIVSLLYSSGIRISELCSLNRDSIKEGSFTVVGKGGHARLCFVDARTATLLAEYLQSREDGHPALFLTKYAGRITPSVVQDSFRSIYKRSGIECHPHTLRHSFATNLLKSILICSMYSSLWATGH